MKHASVTELEQAFAQNPDSTAYLPLCEAYLEQGRFMEAMVVAKKGIKAHADSVEARVLLARVYARQKKTARALQEMDDVIAAFPTRGLALLERAKIRDESGDKTNAIADLKKAIDLEPTLSEATKLLADRGIEYPEKPPEPPPPPPPAAPPPGWPMVPGYPVAPDPRGASMVGGVPPGASLAPPGMPLTGGWTLPTGVPVAGLPPPGVGAPGPSWPAPAGVSGIYAQRQRLEGEDELEAIASKVAEEKPQTGNARTSLWLLIGLVVIVSAAIGWQIKRKREKEGIAELSNSAQTLANQDTYGGYKKAVVLYERLLDSYDSTHAPTLGRLAHIDAILWGEHGDGDGKSGLDRILPLAERHAADQPGTLAARGLGMLYGGEDRQKAASAAYERIGPPVQKTHESAGAGTIADLALAIFDLELGNYDSALNGMSTVKQASPTNVRAKVWFGRASFRAGRHGAAEGAFTDALRASQDHPGARAGRALVRIQRGNLEGAAEDVLKFDEFAQKQPKEVSRRDNAQIEYARSEVFRAAGDDAKAAGAYENAIRFDPSNADFPYGLGRWLLQNGREKESLEPLRKAVKMEGTRRAFLIALSEAEAAGELYDPAILRLEGLLKQNPKDLPASIAKARVLSRQKKPEAETFLKEVIAWSNGSVEANLELGRYYRAIGKKVEARAPLEKAIEVMGNHPPTQQGDVLIEYAKLMCESGEDGVCLNTYKKAAELGAMEAWYRIIQLLAPSVDPEQHKEAVQACERYLNAGASLQYSSSARATCAGLK